MNRLALSAAFGVSSPKGGAFGKTVNFAGTAKASLFDRLPPTGGRCRVSDRKGSKVARRGAA